MSEFLIIALCLILNALLSCIEMAFVTASKAQIKKLAESGSVAAKRVSLLKANPERTLSVLQIGITLVGAISAAVSGAGAEEFLGPRLIQTFGFSPETSEYVAIAIIILPLTYASVVIGELVPKSIALRFPIRIALLGGQLLIFLDRLFFPFVALLEASTKLLTYFVFSNFRSENIYSSNGDVDLENLSETHKQYVFNLINFDKRTVKDVMLDWEDTTTINETDHHREVLEKIKSSRHTRMPVIDSNNSVIGLLHTKEFIAESEVAKLDWKQLIRSVMSLNPGEPLLSAIKKLQSSKSHLAIIKRDAVLVGIVTIEDIFEEVVGEIYDEDDGPNTLLSTNSKIRHMNLK
jgi:putative hemolysin